MSLLANGLTAAMTPVVLPPGAVTVIVVMGGGGGAMARCQEPSPGS